MLVSQNANLAKIAARSLSLSERLSVGEISGTLEDFDAATFFAQWDEATGGKLEARLAQLSLSREEVHRRLAVAPETNLEMRWLEILAAALDHTDAITPELRDPVFTPGAPVLFEEALLPFVLVARRELTAHVTPGLLSDTALIELERALLRQLSGLARRVFWLEFSVFRAERSFGLFFASLAPELQNATDNNPPRRDIYDAWLQKLAQDGLVTLFERYSALARLLATVTYNWIAAHTEFYTRLTADLPLIRETWSAIADRVVNVQPALSDPHRGGRSVIGVEFECGLQLIYKPRNLAVEAAFSGLLDWCNAQNPTLDFKSLRVLNLASHGWVERAPEIPTSADQRPAYYRRTGMLLAALYLLRGADYHYQNLLTCGEYPVAIDQEGLLYPEIHNPLEDSATGLAHREFSRTVLRIGLLPAWNGSENGGASDVSALGGSASGTRANWLHPNTDRMAFRNSPATPESRVAEPQADYVNQIIAGFEEVYGLFLAHRAELLRPGSPLTAFVGVPTRFVFRNTQLYATLAQNSLEPKHLRDGLSRSLQLERLSRAFLCNSLPAAQSEVLTAEMAALQNGDIPIFGVNSAKTDLQLEDTGGEASNLFAQPGYEQVIEQFTKWDESDLARQTGYIHASFYAQRATDAAQNPTLSVSIPETALELTSVEFSEAALELGLRLENQALRDGKAATWIFLGYDKRINRYRLNPLDFTLYSGLGGVALFLAGLAHVTGEKRFGELARGAWETRLPLLRQSEYVRRAIKQLGIGGGLGVGGLLYSLVRCGTLLKDAELIETAGNLLRLDGDLIANDKKYDLIFGAGGAILSLLSLYATTNDPRALAQAQLCGEHLLNYRTTDAETGLRAWTTIDGKLATGFSHGAAGIAYALLKLGAATGETAFGAAAREAIAWENSRYAENVRNWLYYRATPEQPTAWTTWCHGATGIGLARVAGLPYHDTSAVRDDINRALDTTVSYGLRDIDHLCCGNFGRGELFVEAARRLNNPAWLATARTWGSQLVARARQGEGYRILPGASGDAYSPGFFQGTSGVGYALLRLADPSALPSALLWE
jgi:type 2 lantibiotic biosynthesis protein LanM